MRDAGHYNGAGLIEIGKRFAAGSIAVLKPSDSEQADVDGELRQWTYKTGKSIKAALVGIEDDRVKLEKEDGRILSVAIKRLSDADQEFLKQQSAAD